MSEKEVIEDLEGIWSENKLSLMRRKSRKSFNMYYRPFLLKMRSIFCKIVSRKGVLKALESNLSENKVRSIDINGNIEFPLEYYRPLLAKTRSMLCWKKSKKRY